MSNVPFVYQIVLGLALDTGLNHEQAVVATAIAAAESRLNPIAVGINPNGSVYRGLWQIKVRAHPDVDEYRAYDLRRCAQDMFNISKSGTQWSAWSAYRDGSYKKYFHLTAQALRDKIAAQGAPSGQEPQAYSDYLARLDDFILKGVTEYPTTAFPKEN